MQPAERFLPLNVSGSLLAGVPRQNSVIYGALTMRHVLWRTGHSDPFQHGVTRTTGVTLFVVPNLPGDSKTT
jgi:hypothetical protein